MGDHECLLFILHCSHPTTITASSPCVPLEYSSISPPSVDYWQIILLVETTEWWQMILITDLLFTSVALLTVGHSASAVSNQIELLE